MFQQVGTTEASESSDATHLEIFLRANESRLVETVHNLAESRTNRKIGRKHQGRKSVQTMNTMVTTAAKVVAPLFPHLCGSPGGFPRLLEKLDLDGGGHNRGYPLPVWESRVQREGRGQVFVALRVGRCWCFGKKRENVSACVVRETGESTRGVKTVLNTTGGPDC